MQYCIVTWVHAHEQVLLAGGIGAVGEREEHLLNANSYEEQESKYRCQRGLMKGDSYMH